MFLRFYDGLRRQGVPASLREAPGVLALAKAGLATQDIHAFYHFARTGTTRRVRPGWHGFSRTFRGIFGSIRRPRRIGAKPARP